MHFLHAFDVEIKRIGERLGDFSGLEGVFEFADGICTFFPDYVIFYKRISRAIESRLAVDGRFTKCSLLDTGE